MIEAIAHGKGVDVKGDRKELLLTVSQLWRLLRRNRSPSDGINVRNPCRSDESELEAMLFTIIPSLDPEPRKDAERNRSRKLWDFVPGKAGTVDVELPVGRRTDRISEKDRVKLHCSSLSETRP